MADIITQEKLIELREAKDKAMESDIPFPIVKGDDIAVVGDANKTELNKHDFNLIFIIPNENGSYDKRTVQYKGVYLKPRHAVTIQRLMTALQPMFYKIREGGGIADLTDEEMIEVATMYEGQILDHIYHLVSVVLDVDDRLIDFVDPVSVLEAFKQIMIQYPDLVKASDSFFELSSGEKKAPSKKG